MTKDEQNSFDELKAKMLTALQANDIKVVEELAQKIDAGKRERRKAEVAKAQAEATELAGDREALAIEVHKSIKALGIDKKLVALKSWGFTYKVDKANPAEPDVSYKSVALTTAIIKKRASGGNGGAGKTKDEFGISLSEVYVKYGTADDDAKLAEAKVKDEQASAKLGKTTNSNQWRVKNEVKKRALAENLIAPVK